MMTNCPCFYFDYGYNINLTPRDVGTEGVTFLANKVIFGFDLDPVQTSYFRPVELI